MIYPLGDNTNDESTSINETACGKPFFYARQLELFQQLCSGICFFL